MMSGSSMTGFKDSATFVRMLTMLCVAVSPACAGACCAPSADAGAAIVVDCSRPVVLVLLCAQCCFPEDQVRQNPGF